MSRLNDSLLKLLSLPTAPYREESIQTFIDKECKDHGIPYFKDPIGNRIIGVKNKADYLKVLEKKSSEPMRIFIAHMDHPGFHGIKWCENGNLEIQWFGGSPVSLLEGALVRVHAKSSSETNFQLGALTNVELMPHGRAIKRAEVKILESMNDSSVNRLKATDLYGAFHFEKPVWVEGENIYSKCCDDLIGVHILLETAKMYWSKETISSSKNQTKKKMSPKKFTPPPFIALLTRAEEVGFIGAIGHFELGWIHQGKRPRFVVSLETSRTLPGADIGAGPIVRLGDRMNVFDPALTHWLSKLALNKLPNEHQKRIMDKGACEASAALAYGLRTIALSVPLGNYHNESFEGGPESRHPGGPAPEFVAIKDVEGLLKIVNAIVSEKVSLKPEELYKDTRAGFKKSLKNAKNLLK